MDFLLLELHNFKGCCYVISKIRISKHFHNFIDIFVFQCQKESYPIYFSCSLFFSKLSSVMYNMLNNFCKYTSYITQQSSHTCLGHQILMRIAEYSQSQTLILLIKRHGQGHCLKVESGYSLFEPQPFLYRAAF